MKPFSGGKAGFSPATEGSPRVQVSKRGNKTAAEVAGGKNNKPTRRRSYADFTDAIRHGKSQISLSFFFPSFRMRTNIITDSTRAEDGKKYCQLSIFIKTSQAMLHSFLLLEYVLSNLKSHTSPPSKFDL